MLYVIKNPLKQEMLRGFYNMPYIKSAWRYF